MSKLGFIKKHYKGFLLFSGCCIVCLSLGFNMVILPWYDKQQMKAKEKALEPLGASIQTIGYTGAKGENANLVDYIRGAWATATYTGSLKSISVNLYIASAGSNLVKCALYAYTDYGTNYAGAWIASTEIKTITTTGAMAQTYEFNFSSYPVITANTKYYLCAWADAISGASITFGRKYDASVTDNCILRSVAYAAWPNPLTSESSQVDYNYCIYGSYSRFPTQSSPSPTNSSTGVALTPKCAITVADIDADTMTVKFFENSTGSYLQRQTNSSCANGTYRWTYAQATTYNTKYYWKVSVNDFYTNVTAWYKFTTRAENSPTSSVDAITPYLQQNNPLAISATASDTGSGVKNVTLWYRWNDVNDSWDATPGGSSTYHFTTWGGDGWDNPDGMVDEDDESYSSSEREGQTEIVDDPNSTGTGTISYVYLRCRAYNDKGGGGSMTLQPLFPAIGDGDTHDIRLDATPTWYTVDITNDTNAPGVDYWTWSDFDALRCNVISHAVDIVYCSSVQIIVETADTGTWQTISTGINGSIYNNTGAWNIISQSINGSIYNMTGSWKTISTNINGSIFNSSINTWQTIDTSINGSVYNVSAISWVIISQNINGSIFNRSAIIISNEHPVNNSLNNPIPITLSITITDVNGYDMNITWWWGNSSANATHYLGSTFNVANGTYSMAIPGANITSTYYWWRVNVSDFLANYENESLTFKTSISTSGGTTIITGGRDRFVMGLVIGSMIFLILGFVLFRRKKRKI